MAPVTEPIATQLPETTQANNAEPDQFDLFDDGPALPEIFTVPLTTRDGSVVGGEYKLCIDDLITNLVQPTSQPSTSIMVLSELGTQ